MVTIGVELETNFVLIDYENVKPTNLKALNKEQFKVIVFVGANQSKIPFEFVSDMQSMGNRAEYIKASGIGHNALDFHLAYYLGQLVVHNPKSFFYIVSKDNGFNPLIEHLKTKNINACRSSSIEEIPMLKITDIRMNDETISIVISNLKSKLDSKPKTLKTLMSSINAIFKKQLNEQELNELICQLKSKSIITLNGSKIEYNFA